ncbi:MAG TPA: hypothetical protein VNL77_19290 [Roseiflexaceae bacterium]|nr:hypothetical protein [Roseiflexaceae bacterium]
MLHEHGQPLLRPYDRIAASPHRRTPARIAASPARIAASPVRIAASPHRPTVGPHRRIARHRGITLFPFGGSCAAA